MYVTLANGTKVECDDNFFAEGGEGRIYWDKAGTHVIKLYTRVEPTREETLRQIVGQKYNVVLNEPNWKRLFAWPEAIIRSPSLGITMQRIKGTDLLWFLYPKSRQAYAAKNGLAKLGKWQNYVQMAIKMAQVVSRMHLRGLCHSDLSFKNFMGDPSSDSVVLLDCDSLVVPGIIPPKVLGTPLCMAPELASQLTGGPPVEPTVWTDLHALATLIYWLLLQRHPLAGPKQHHQDPALSEALALGANALFIEDPKDKSNQRRDLPPRLSYQAMLTPAVADLVTKSFVDGLHNPGARPLAGKWEQAIKRMLDALVPCDNPTCPMGNFVLNPDLPGKAQCACGRPLNSPSVLPIFRFFKPVQGRVGQYKNDEDYFMVGWPDRVFHEWHSTLVDTGPVQDDRAKAKLIYDRSSAKWHLQNVDFPELCLLDSLNGHKEIKPGQKSEIRHGSSLMFGPPGQCRMASIQMRKMQ
jgi:serine/threonine protein kinase